MKKIITSNLREEQKILLNLIFDWYCLTISQINILLSKKDNGNVRQRLERLVEQKLVTKKTNKHFYSFNYYSLTKKGLHHIDRQFNRAETFYFTQKHHQDLIIEFLRENNIKNYQTDRQIRILIGKKNPTEKICDLRYYDKESKQNIGIEIEWSIKTRKRYRSILEKFNQKFIDTYGKENGLLYDKVCYFVRKERFNQLKKIFNEESYICIIPITVKEINNDF